MKRVLPHINQGLESAKLSSSVIICSRRSKLLLTYTVISMCDIIIEAMTHKLLLRLS